MDLSIFTNNIPDDVGLLYKNHSKLVQWYVCLRWRLCPFAEIESYVPREGNILDLGCGFGILSNLLWMRSNHRNIIGIDKSDKRIKCAQKTIQNRDNIQFSVMDVEETPFDNISAVIATDMFHHIPDDKLNNLLAIVSAKFNNNGRLVILDVIKTDTWKYYFTYCLDNFLNTKDKVYFREKNEMLRILENHSFSVRVIPADKGLPLQDAIFICDKMK